jgi:hypothetical protein
MARMPAIMITRATTQAKIGRSMKKRDTVAPYPPAPADTAAGLGA